MPFIFNLRRHVLASEIEGNVTVKEANNKQDLSAAVTAAPAADLITSRPGYSQPFVSKSYSGYVQVGTPDRVRHLRYFFTESESATSDPVVLWLNGGSVL